MEKGGLIKNRYTFLIQCLFYEYGRSDNPVLPGTYLLNNSMTGKEIILELRDGVTEEEKETESAGS